MSIDLVLPHPAVVLGDLVPMTRMKDACLVVGAAGFVGLLAQIAIPLSFTPVPLTGQTFGVLLAGTALGARRGVAALALYAVAGLLGVPWFAQGTAGWDTASFGYVIGFCAAAALCGALADRGADRRLVTAAMSMVAGTVAVYVFGLGWLAAVSGMPAGQLMRLGVTPFLIGDAVKLVLAAGLTPLAWRLVCRSNR